MYNIFGTIIPEKRRTTKMINGKKTSFEVNPLDINLAKIQMNLISRAEREIPKDGDFAPIYEEFCSKDPTLDLSTIKVVCRHQKGSEKKNNIRYIEAISKNRAMTKEKSKVLCKGTKEDILKYLKDTDIFEECKKLAKHFD